MIRSRWNHGGPRAANGGNCGRLDDGVSCGDYFVITDQLGKPVVMLDSNGLITGSGEYQPFGHVNRVPQDAESAHPSPHNVNSYWQRFTQPRLGLQLGMRMHLELDVDPWGDSVTIEEQQPDMSWFQFGNAYSGSAMGLVWTDWSVTSQGQASEQRLRFASDNYSCPPSGPCSVVWPYKGFTMPDYEYRRYQTTPVWTPLRLPGHYHDAETDLFENWHRYYSADTGRYLSPEPALMYPAVVREMLSAGSSPVAMSSYAYAANSPTNYTDQDGRLLQALFLLTEGVAAEGIASQIMSGAGIPLISKLVVDALLPDEPPVVWDDPDQGVGRAKIEKIIVKGRACAPECDDAENTIRKLLDAERAKCLKRFPPPTKSKDPKVLRGWDLNIRTCVSKSQSIPIVCDLAIQCNIMDSIAGLKELCVGHGG
jgi:RHS repeat-associated protein